MASNSNSISYRKKRQISTANRMHYFKFSNKTCSYKKYKCPVLCIEGYSFCINHILEDEHAPFQQCAYTYRVSLKRCPQAAPKNDAADSFCPEHLHKMQRSRNRVGKSQPPLSIEKLASSLSHLVKPNYEGDYVSDEIVKNPFQDINAIAVNNSRSNVLDYCSESDSDIESSIIARTPKVPEESASDPESAEEDEDFFKYASAFTADEILLKAKIKSHRLRTLYMGQLRRLNYVLRERRREYLIGIQKEKETLCSIAEQRGTSPREAQLAEKVKCMNHYRRPFGVEAILRKKLKNKRRGLTLEAAAARPGVSKCIFTEGGVKCNIKTLPNAKLCPKHILSDPYQVLFRPCGHQTEDDICREPVIGTEACIYHMKMTPKQITYNTAVSSEDEEESKEEVDCKTTFNSPTTFGGDELDMVEDIIKMDESDTKMDFCDDDFSVVKEEIVVCDDLLMEHTNT